MWCGGFVEAGERVVWNESSEGGYSVWFSLWDGHCRRKEGRKNLLHIEGKERQGERQTDQGTGSEGKCGR